MNKEFIPYEQALVLKELGFDEPCYFATYLCSANLIPREEEDGWDLSKGIIAPLYQQAFRWFREKYGLLCSPFSTLNEENNQVMFYFEIGKIKEFVVDVYSEDKFTYEEAELACLIKLIEIVKQDKKL